MKFNLQSEYQSRVLWYFIAFVFGCTGYFALTYEPSLSMMCVVTIILAVACYVRKQVWLKLVFFGVLGVCVATCRTCFIQTEFLRKPLRQQEMTATVQDAFLTERGQIVVLDHLTIPKAAFVPERVRMSFKGFEPRLRQGDTITFTGSLYAPNAQQAQRFFYQGVSAQGQITRLLTQQKADEPLLDHLRFVIMDRLKQLLSPQASQIAIPLVVGEQGVVSRDMYDVYRKAGIAHVLSVSGFHMVLLATFVFFLIRGFLALFPYIALRLPGKKIAAFVAFFVTGFYLSISGLQVPAIRSFMMISLVFLGVLTDRKVVSLYTLGLVAFVVLMIRPEWVCSVSFQLSFVAVMVLVGVFEDLSKRLPKSLFCRVVVTGFVANVLVTLALAPFVAYHFNQFNPYGVIGNLLTSLLFSFCIMPCLFLGTILIPLNLESLPFQVAGFMLEKVTVLAQMIASWPYAEVVVPAFSGWILGVIAFGLVVLCVMKSRLRLFGLVFIGGGLLVGFFYRSVPDIFVSGKNIVVRQGSVWQVVQGSPTDWNVRQFLKRQGQEQVDFAPCDRVNIRGKTIAFSSLYCGLADLVVLSKKDSDCSDSRILNPRFRVGYQIFVRDSVVIRSDEEQDRFRPWGLMFKRKEKYEN